jgi:hypothetical protein
MKYLSSVATVACMALVLTCAWISPLDTTATAKVDSGLKNALATYATARILHGVISALQGTQIDAAPAGVGATFTPGQILAPAAEMLKQFSDLMLIVCASFALQKLLIAIGGYAAVSVALSVVAVGWTLSTFLHRKQAPPWLSKILIVMLLIRFAVPLMILGSDLIFQNVLLEKYQISHAGLDATSKNTTVTKAEDLASASNIPKSLAQSQSPQVPAGSGLNVFSKLNELVDNINAWMKNKAAASVAKYDALQKAANEAVEHVVMLMAVFALQTIVLPLLILFGLRGLANVVLQLPKRREQLQGISGPPSIA